MKFALLTLALVALAHVGTSKAAPTSVSVTPKDCENVQDWNFMNAQVTVNNLGGVGPNKEDTKEIRYSGVANGIDLVLTTDAPYAVNPKVKDFNGTQLDGAGNNGINGKFGQVNVKGNTAVQMTFTLVEEGSDVPVSISPDTTIFFSVYDLDRNPFTKPSYEYVDFTTPVDSYRVTNTTTAKVTGDDKHLYAMATRFGDDADNPSDPLNMTQLQLDSAVWITYKGRNTWGMTFGEKANAKGKGGRNLLFAGRAEGDCPADVPMIDPAGFCTAGIQGVVQGGGLVCCPDACGYTAASGAPTLPKFSGAPYACGGPNCEKDVNGKRDLAPGGRYDNCCVGKPVTGGSDIKTINAPWGIVHQRRFCKGGEDPGAPGLGSDAPPCIERLTRK